jgi:hypothetical protein
MCMKLFDRKKRINAHAGCTVKKGKRVCPRKVGLACGHGRVHALIWTGLGKAPYIPSYKSLVFVNTFFCIR